MNAWSKTFQSGIGIACVLAGLAFANITQAATVSFSLRYQDTLVFSGPVDLPSTGTVSVSDSNGVQRAVGAQSVLGILAALDGQSSAFSLSSVAYYAQFNSLYLKCVQIADPAVNACDNWQYVVNGTTPFVGMDSYAAQAGDQIFLYFGNSRQVALSKAITLAGETITASAQKYQYQDNTWIPLSGVTIGVTLPNLQNPSPIETATQSVDGVGNAFFTIEREGDYSAGIKEDFYFPSVSFRVLPKITSGGVSPTSSNPASVKEFDSRKAIDFLASLQNTDGSFQGNPMLSDRAAIAFGAYGTNGAVLEKLKAYLLANPDPGRLLTDYERRAMALMALGVNPYSGAGVDYVRRIVSSFDGTQIGDSGLINDDIFALIVLQNAGYEEADPVIAKPTDFILSRQQGNGSWGDTDYTAAAIQALAFQQNDRVKSALKRARSYLADKQESSGGFGNMYSTAWATQAIGALGESGDAWKRNGRTPKDFLAANQAPDGGLEQNETAMNRIWITSDAIPAAFGKPWGPILGRFTRPENFAISGGLPVQPASPGLQRGEQAGLPLLEQSSAAESARPKPSATAEQEKPRRDAQESVREAKKPAIQTLPEHGQMNQSARAPLAQQNQANGTARSALPREDRQSAAASRGQKQNNAINGAGVSKARDEKAQERLTASAISSSQPRVFQNMWSAVKSFVAAFFRFFR